MSTGRLLALLSLAAALGACMSWRGGGREWPEPPPLTPVAELCGDAALAPDDFCLPVARSEALLADPTAEVLAVATNLSGWSLPKVVHLRGRDAAGELIYKVKWKAAPGGGEGFNNSPRKELAAYAIQPLFLEPFEYVVPPTLARCVPTEEHRDLFGAGRRTFSKVDCVLVVLAWWIVNASPDSALDLEDFAADPRYARAMAHVNLFTYLLDHRDTRAANFLRSTDPDRPRVFAIDNGLAFGGFKNPFQFVGMGTDWSALRVPSLPRDTVERLRGLGREDLDPLLVVTQFRMSEEGMSRTPPGPPLDRKRGTHREGDTLQLGLAEREIDGVWTRLEALLARIDAGEVLTI